jgi:trk system potassium uptake protein TrkH
VGVPPRRSREAKPTEIHPGAPTDGRGQRGFPNLTSTTTFGGAAGAGPASRHRAGTRQDPGHASRWARFRRTLGPERLLVLSFAGLIVVGTLGFRLLPGLYVGERLSWLDALFTATSAICVTGLIVVDTATYFTPFGQAYLALLIQVGGLGIITFTTLLMLALGRRLSLHHEAVSAGGVGVAPDVDFRDLVRNVVRFTLALEAVGALVLFIAWVPDMGLGAAGHAAFHAVSAFCNAGFSTFADNVVGFRASAFTLGVVMSMVVTGGVGFLVLEEMHLLWKQRGSGRRTRLSLHSQLVLGTTAVMLMGGWLAMAVLEWDNTLAGLGLFDRLGNALFMSVTPRTAGFNSIDYSQASEGTSFVTILLMSVGGSPGSTAGGLKTTTVAAIGLLALARLRGGHRAHALGRTIPDDTIQRAVGLFAVSFAIVTLGILLLVVTQGGPGSSAGGVGFLPFMFEAVSAFNTVGLSLGATHGLDGTGKWIIILLMYVGRVGPLALAAAVSLSRTTGDRDFRYAYEDVLIG